MGRILAEKFRAGENALSITVLAAMSLLPLIEIVGRRLPTGGVPGSVSKIDPITNTVARTVIIPTGVRGVASDGTHIWIIRFLESSGLISL